jgi:hypothetical protein
MRSVLNAIKRSPHAEERRQAHLEARTIVVQQDACAKGQFFHSRSVGAGDRVLTPDNVRVGDEAVGDDLGMLDQIGRVPDDPWADQRLARALLELILDLVKPGLSASVVEIAAGRSRRADCADHLVVDLDYDAAAKQEQVRQFEQVREHRVRFRPFDECARAGLERRGRKRFGESAVKGMGADAVAAQYSLLHTIGIDHHSGLRIALARTFRDGRGDDLDREASRNAVRREQALRLPPGPPQEPRKAGKEEVASYHR